MLKYVSILFFIFGTSNLINAQERIGDKIYDNDLSIAIVKENVRKVGFVEICIFNRRDNLCVENLFTAFEIRVYDKSGKEVWNGLWMGRDKKIKFKKPLPNAFKIIVTAKKPFAINAITGTKIYQDKPMQVETIVK